MVDYQPLPTMHNNWLDAAYQGIAASFCLKICHTMPPKYSGLCPSRAFVLTRLNKPQLSALNNCSYRLASPKRTTWQCKLHHLKLRWFDPLIASFGTALHCPKMMIKEPWIKWNPFDSYIPSMDLKWKMNYGGDLISSRVIVYNSGLNPNDKAPSDTFTHNSIVAIPWLGRT